MAHNFVLIARKLHFEARNPCPNTEFIAILRKICVVLPFVAGLYLLFAHRRELSDVVVQTEDGASEKECLGDVEDKAVWDIIYPKQFYKHHHDG